MLVDKAHNLPPPGEENLGFRVTSQDGMPDPSSRFLLGHGCNGSVTNNYSMSYMSTAGCMTQCEQYSSTNSSASRRTTVGQSHVRGGWTVESQSQLLSGIRQSDSWEEAHYTNTTAQVIGNGKNNNNNNNNNNAIFSGNQRSLIKHQSLIHCVSAPTPTSPGTRGGQCPMSTDFGNNANTSSFFSDDPKNHAPINHRMSGLNGDMLSLLRSSNSVDPSWTSSYGTPTMVANSPHVGFGDVERPRILPLRFKMLPSPVQYDKFLNSLANPTEGDLAPYYRVMMRWYEHIVVTQESTRSRVRSVCPSPPECLKQLRDGDLQDIPCLGSQDLQTWATQCCIWWEEISRKRGRRGHRGGKTQSNGGATKLVGMHHRPVADTVGTYAGISYNEPSNHKSEENGIDSLVHRFCNAVLDDE